MKSTDVHAVEMTRRIRAQHAEQLRDATPEERIRFYRGKAGKLCAETEAVRRSKKSSA